jgi:hypothetical protein
MLNLGFFQWEHLTNLLATLFFHPPRLRLELLHLAIHGFFLNALLIVLLAYLFI